MLPYLDPVVVAHESKEIVPHRKGVIPMGTGQTLPPVYNLIRACMVHVDVALTVPPDAAPRGIVDPDGTPVGSYLVSVMAFVLHAASMLTTLEPVAFL